MINLLIWLLCLLLGDCHIAPENRVPNRTNQQCVWASLETQARHWGIKQLYTLTQDHTGPAGEWDAWYAIRNAGVLAFWGNTGRPDWGSLELASELHYPVSVCISGPGWSHMITLVDLGPDFVNVIDNSGPWALEEQTWSRTGFARLWTGWFVILRHE